MRTPISVNYEERGIDGVYITFQDANGNKHEPEDVMAALNNAATGPWEEGDVPDGKRRRSNAFRF